MESFWAITSYFNPCGYYTRLANYKVFRKFLNVPLITVELSFNNQFDLKQDDADILIQIKGDKKNIMWQKERLLNIALPYLPEECHKFAWLDCDVVFPDKNWATKTKSELDNFKLVQPFSRACHLHQKILPEVISLEQINNTNYLFIENSGGFHFRKNQSAKLSRGRGYENSFAVGMAWASHKEIFITQGFYDASIMGSGDCFFWCAAHGKFSEIIQRSIEKFKHNSSRSHHYLAWGQPFFERIKASVSFIDCDLYHLQKRRWLDN